MPEFAGGADIDQRDGGPGSVAYDHQRHGLSRGRPSCVGTVLISWPSFQTAQGDVVTAGNQSVEVAQGGAFLAQLVPNAGASPMGTYYVAVFQLDDGTVRTVLVGANDFTDNDCSNKNDSWNGIGEYSRDTGLREHGSNDPSARLERGAPCRKRDDYGGETICGGASSSGAGGKQRRGKQGIRRRGGTKCRCGGLRREGRRHHDRPLNLAGPPTSPAQASNRQYVDNGLTAKADLVTGVVPPGELGSGVATSDTCLNGNSTWGSCGGGAPAGISYATTALNWSQTIAGSLSSGSQATVTLTPCPVGIDTTSNAGYQVLLSGGGNSEAVNVLTTAGACTSGAASGTITFTPFNSYSSGYTIGSASSGIQETLNAACGTDSTSWKNAQCNVTIPSNGPGYPIHSVATYNVDGTIYLHTNQSVLSGYGASLNCNGRGPCMQIGDLKNSNDYANNTVLGVSFRTPTNLSAAPRLLEWRSRRHNESGR